ncbi:MAG: patatin-like phospholipase family protein [Treponema sp.]|nr:patatin-like phospholipase family protein [Treponema sp.]
MKKLVLSVSGGGALGIGPLHFMKKLEEDLGIKKEGLGSICSAFAGTSTGSIIATGLRNGMTAKKLFDLYKKNLSSIFKARNIRLFDSLSLKKINTKKFSLNDVALLLQENYYRYDNSGLIKLLKENFPDRMNCNEKLLFIPTTYMNGESVEKVWDNKDTSVEQSFAVLTSCSAPTYFDTVKDRGREFCDGGMWANDPIMVLESGIKEFCKKSKYEKMFADGFKILSFNTGMAHPNKGPDGKNIVSWLFYMVDEWIARTGESNLFEARANIGAENIYRCCPKTDKTYAMDDLKVLDEVIEEWDKYYKSAGSFVCEFIESTMEKK